VRAEVSDLDEVSGMRERGVCALVNKHMSVAQDKDGG
jgi:hypothetical protein